MRSRLLVGLVLAGCWLLPGAAWSAEPGQAGEGRQKEGKQAEQVRPGQRLLPVWRALLLVYREVEVDYADEGGKKHHFTNRLPDEEVRAAVWSFRQFPSLAYKHSGGEVVIQYDIVYPRRAIDSVTAMGKDVWWISPNDTRPEIDRYAPKGRYDSILVLAPLADHAKGKSVPTGGWGLAIGPSDWSNGATYCTVGNAPVDGWNEPAPGEVWLHEWLHGSCAHFASKGFAMPKGDSDGGETHGYKHSPVEGWGQFYRDLMNGQVLEGDCRMGVTQAAWRTGPIFGKRQLVVADFFASDTTACYQTQGKAAWTGRGGKQENVALGSAQGGSSAIRLPVDVTNKCTITARTQIPGSVAGENDSVGIVLGDGKAERCASLEYGTKWAGKARVSIGSGQAQEKSAPVSLTPGWHTLKLLIDPAGKTMRMKAWPDGKDEPESWQVTTELETGWRATSAGLKHVGRTTLVDDLLIVQEPGEK